MESALFAQVLATDDSNSLTIGTGYPISKDLVITALHVVSFFDRNKAIPIKIVWSKLVTDGQVVEETVENEFIYECECENTNGDGIAILRCKVPNGKENSPVFLAKNKSDIQEGKWASFGYPLLGVEGNIWKKVSLKGTFYPADESVIDLDYFGGEQVKEHWAGISGAAVFQGNQLYAIIIDIPTKIEKRFRAISIPWLLSHKSEFFQDLGLVKVYDPTEYFKKIDKDIKLALKDMDGTPLYKALAKGFIATVTEASAENIYTAIKKALDKDKIKLIEDYRLVCKRILLKDPDSIEPAIKLFELLLAFMASNFFDQSSKLHHLPVKTRMAVEIELAARYQLAPNLEKVKKSSGHKGKLVGKHAINVDGLRETGWRVTDNVSEINEVIQVAINKVCEQVDGEEPTDPLDEFDLDTLNETLKTRRKDTVEPELIRFEVDDSGKEEDKDHPLLNNKVCEAIQGSQNLPDLPIVRYGFSTAEHEAKLYAQVAEFYRLIHEAEQTV